jgi:hypothetical protein
MQVITPLIQFQQQLRIFHWQTDSHAAHEAFGKAYEDIDEIIDTFVETYMGIYGRSKPTVTFQITLKPLSGDDTVTETLSRFISYLKDMSLEIDDTDLLNIRDEMLALTNRLIYRLSLS